jgi:hypothetical protein
VAAKKNGAADAEPAATSTDLEHALDVRGLVERHPYGTLAAALGAGYVLGGGLFTALTGRLVRAALGLGLRFVVLPTLEQEAIELVTRLAGDRDAAAGST